ncbi:hypothetical protein K505DRAFT_325225 [Melanomma pulvis-pyrius CBS 109.77]|uniref:Uncharacterized protein n=1 Tax=Melanomma pulvis-pyrius CBS 109.77 TaxID=1314802 RepID=A0A6A6XCP1_9PLEO|nr:hypothetical protein K505DRAFT_325225 [Melanomma pulvis-pyrius CBS 109.77]
MLPFVKRLRFGQPGVRAPGSVVAVQPVLPVVDVERLSSIGEAGGACCTGRALLTIAENDFDGTLVVVAMTGMMSCQLLVDIKVLGSIDDSSTLLLDVLLVRPFLHPGEVDIHYVPRPGIGDCQERRKSLNEQKWNHCNNWQNEAIVLTASCGHSRGISRFCIHKASLSFS